MDDRLLDWPYLDELFIPVSGLAWNGLDVRAGLLNMDADDLCNKVAGRDRAEAICCQMLAVLVVPSEVGSDVRDVFPVNAANPDQRIRRYRARDPHVQAFAARIKLCSLPPPHRVAHHRTFDRPGGDQRLRGDIKRSRRTIGHRPIMEVLLASS